MQHKLEFFKCDECEGMFKLLPNGSLGRCYLLRSSAGECIEVTCLPVVVNKICAFLNMTTEETWKVYDLFDIKGV